MRRALVVVCGLAFAPVAYAPVAYAADTRVQAAQILDLMGIDHILVGEIRNGRHDFARYQQRFGKSENEGDDAYVRYILPDLIAHRPELQSRLQDVVIKDLTAAEILAVAADDTQNEPWRTAQTKARLLKDDLGHTFERWRSEATAAAYAKNAATMNDLGIHLPPPKD